MSSKREGPAWVIAQAPSLYKILPLVRCGFELETQRLGGRSMSDINLHYRNCGPDGGRSVEETYADKLAKLRDPDKIIKFIRAASRSYGHCHCTHGTFSRYFIGLISSTKDIPEDVFMDKLLKACAVNKDITAQVAQRFISAAWISYVRYSYPYSQTSSVLGLRDREWRTASPALNWEKYCKETIRLPEECNMTSDGSVSGPEIRTIGGITVQDFCRVVNALFDRQSFVIDEHCSFHIHLSVNGVEHKYGEMFQAWMMEYLFLHMNSMPETVISRFCYYECRGEDDDDDDDDGYMDEDEPPCTIREQGKYWMDTYFPFNITEDRYAFVSYRGRTWEFRCFGNVQTAKEAKICLLLAIGAIKYAYGCSKGLINPYIHSKKVWGRVCAKLREYVKGRIRRKTAMATLIKESAEVRREKKRRAA